MTQSLRHAISVPGGAGGRIAAAAGGQDDRVRRQLQAVCHPDAGDPLSALRILPGQDFRNFLMQPETHAPALAETDQGAGDVAGVLAAGEHAAAPLHLHRTAVFLQQGHQVLGGEGGEGAVQKSSVAGHLPQKLIEGTVVGRVAAAFPGQIDFLAGFFIMLQQGDLRPGSRRVNRGHEPGGACSDDQNHGFPFSVRDNQPIPHARAGGADRYSLRRISRSHFRKKRRDSIAEKVSAIRKHHQTASTVPKSCLSSQAAGSSTSIWRRREMMRL